MATSLTVVLAAGAMVQSTMVATVAFGAADPRAQVASSTGRPAAKSERNAYFGDLHLHTAYSFDSYVSFGASVTPDQAYRFARGESIPYEGFEVRRRWPLDFAAVTDHSEYLGMFHELEDPGSAFSQSEFGKKLRAKDSEAVNTVWKNFFDRKPLPDNDRNPLSISAWQQEVSAANRHYQPGKFTTFIAYEWTAFAGNPFSSNEGGIANLHRNVIFRGNTAPVPFTSADSNTPEDLWSYLEKNRERGIEALAIPHNANASNGLMFDWNDGEGKPIGRDYAMRRVLNEPLAEIGQVKGQSEAHPALSGNDEFANFEIQDFTAQKGEKRQLQGSYIRDAYGRGLMIARSIGINPYRFGVQGSTDIHNGLTTSDENAFMSQNHSGIDPLREEFSARFRQTMQQSAGVMELGSGSGYLTGVWAEQNTRASIYDALRRKETFGTSGTRIKMRFFGGWSYPKDILERADWVKIGYERGVPMGADLPAKSRLARAPSFIVWAIKDPDGANLDRLQVIKVWLAGESYKEKIFDVVFSGSRVVDGKSGKLDPVGNTVDLKTATYQNTIGKTELKAVWKDPEFDSATPAVYYLRALEIPTPRWTTIQSVKAGMPLPSGVPATIQERGWSSPIWFAPAAQ